MNKQEIGTFLLRVMLGATFLCMVCQNSKVDWITSQDGFKVSAFRDLWLM